MLPTPPHCGGTKEQHCSAASLPWSPASTESSTPGSAAEPFCGRACSAAIRLVVLCCCVHTACACSSREAGKALWSRPVAMVLTMAGSQNGSAAEPGTTVRSTPTRTHSHSATLQTVGAEPCDVARAAPNDPSAATVTDPAVPEVVWLHRFLCERCRAPSTGRGERSHFRQPQLVIANFAGTDDPRNPSR